MNRSIATCLAMLLVALALPASAASIVAEAQTLGVNNAANLRIPDSRTFVVTAAGQVQVTLRDLGVSTGGATGFTKLKAIVSRGATKVASLATAGTVVFDATPGTYKVQVVGSAVSPAGTFDVAVQTVPGNVSLLQFADGIDAAPVAGNPAQSSLDVTFNISSPGSYQVSLIDRALPSALVSVDLFLLRQGAIPISLSGPCSAAACTANFNVASAGSYNLLVVSTAAAANQSGLYSVAVTGGPSSATVYSTTQPVGRMPAALPLTLPAGGGLTLTLTDFTIPAALSTLRAMVTQGENSLATQAGTGSTSLSAGVAGPASLYVFAGPVAGGAGSYGASVTQGNTIVYRDARPVPEGFDAAANTGGYWHAFSVSTAGSFRAQLRDLAFPSPFSSLRGLLVQNGTAVQSLSSGTIATPALVAGPAIALVFGTPSTAGSNSLYGLSVAPSPAGAAALDLAQGVGPLIFTRSFDIPAAGSHDLAVDDLLFPDPFTDLAVAVTEGSTLVGQIFGGGKVTFTATAGSHAISLLGRPSVAAEYATWGFDVSTTPPAPTLTLSSSAASVTAGGTVTLTWSASNATLCTASGGWTGSRAFSGTATSPAINVDTTYTLTCVGSGGSIIKSSTVTIAAAQPSGGGGGRMDYLLLGLLAFGVIRLLLPGLRARNQ